MIITESNLLNKGVDGYLEKAEKELTLWQSINAFLVQRNVGIEQTTVLQGLYLFKVRSGGKRPPQYKIKKPP